MTDVEQAREALKEAISTEVCGGMQAEMTVIEAIDAYGLAIHVKVCRMLIGNTKGYVNCGESGAYCSDAPKRGRDGE